MLLYFLSQPIVKAFLYRARGDHHDSLNTQVTRVIFWAIPCTIDSMLLSFQWQSDKIPYVMIASFFAGWLASVVRHSAWQSPSIHNYFVMGCITTGMLAIMLTPLIIINHTVLAFIPLGMTGFIASWLGYTKYFNNKTLVIFGRVWCSPDDSSWEELFIGCLPFGLVIMLLGLL